LVWELFTAEADFEVCGEAANGQEAIERAQEFHPDLIILDLSLPVMNGLDAAKVLKTLMPAGR
jgi:YesN/AraC family two-component response regulator